MNVCMLRGPLWFCRHASLHVSLFLLLIHASSPDNFWRWSKRTVQYIKTTKMSKKKSWLKAKPVKAWLNIFFLDQFSLISPFPVNYVFFYILCRSLIYPGYPFFFFKLKAFTVKFLLSKKRVAQVITGMTCRYVYFTSAPSPLLLHSWVLKGICKDLSLCL